MGDLDRAVDDLGTAVAEASSAGARAFAAEARYYLAIALMARRAGDDEQRAADAAAEADRMVQTLGMALYADRARALNAQVRSATPPTPLSPREMDVARLVADGLTNRQVAERLVISERTAQNHVQHVLTKLGFNTRSQIAAWLAGMSKMTGIRNE
jgi:DNA-binding NarL/FixJ family response regulator